MIVTCPACGRNYDDVYNLTNCPHERFKMNTRVYVRGQFRGIAHTVQQYRYLSDEARRDFDEEADKKKKDNTS